MQKILFIVLILSLSPMAYAETEPGTIQYVADEITIMLRSGPSNKHKIIRALTTGTKLEGFETQGDFQRVRTHSGIEGWVLRQHLTDKPIARHLLASANKKLSQLETQNKQLQAQIEQLRDNYNKLNADYRILDKTKAEMASELSHIRSVAAEPSRSIPWTVSSLPVRPSR